MRGLRLTSHAGAVLIATGLLSSSAVAGSGVNRAANPGAEPGSVDGWAGTGISAVRYAADAATPPKTYADNEALGAWLFRASQTGNELVQDVSFADLAAQIDAGSQPIGISARLGASDAGGDGMELVVQPLDAVGAAIGTATQLGPPTAADRQGEGVTLLECRARPIAPAGMRSVRVTMRAVGAPTGPNSAIADQVNIADELYASTVDYGNQPAQAPNCLVRRPAPPTPGPEPSSPPSTPGQTPSPAVAVTSRSPVASRILLGSSRISLRLPAGLTARVQIARATGTPHGRTSWRTVRALTIRTSHAGTQRRALRRLPAGRYRITVRQIAGQQPRRSVTSYVLRPN